MKTHSKRLTVRFLCPTSFNTIAVCFFIAAAVACEQALACGPGRNLYENRPRQNPMQLKQRIPDLDETSVGASGRYSGRVRRGSDAYNALVRNYNTLVVFKDDEKNGDDRLMTERCKDRVDRLAEAVKTKWGALGIKLRVIDAYDVDAGVKKHHGAHSLHHEGRAVDLTTSDRDRTKYPELGRLAYESHFDWVFYPSRGYIHASVKSEKDAEDNKIACFPETAKVRLENGEIRTMNQLNVGDKVESRDSNGCVVYSRVITFLDYKPNSESDFITIETKEPSAEVAITESHLIYQVNTQTRRDAVILAGDVKLGDFVYVRNGSAFKTLTAGRVTGLKRKNGKGAFAPLTETGNIVVDNVLCSCYAVMPRQSLAHWSFAPLRLADWIFPGIAAQEKTGLHRYAMFLYNFYRGWNYLTSYALDNS